MIDTVEQALDLVKSLMAGHSDFRGRPYYVHDVEVMEKLPADAGETERMAALLHSVIDDKAASADALLTLGVPPQVIEIVMIVTNGPSVIGYAAYVQKCRDIIASGNRSAMRIKLADMLANAGHPTNNYDETIRLMRAGLIAAGDRPSPPLFEEEYRSEEVKI